MKGLDPIDVVAARMVAAEAGIRQASDACDVARENKSASVMPGPYACADCRLDNGTPKPRTLAEPPCFLCDRCLEARNAKASAAREAAEKERQQKTAMWVADQLKAGHEAIYDADPKRSANWLESLVSMLKLGRVSRFASEYDCPNCGVAFTEGERDDGHPDKPKVYRTRECPLCKHEDVEDFPGEWSAPDPSTLAKAVRE